VAAARRWGGGGAAKLDVAGTLRIDGALVADGSPSGGCCAQQGGGAAGGSAIRLSVNGALYLLGSVSANGAVASTTTAGSGADGSIWITVGA